MAPGAAGTIWVPYCGAAPNPSEWLLRWNFDPLLVAAITAGALAWCLTVGKRNPSRRKWFAGSVTLIVLLFVSPFCALTSALFSVRAVHHLLLAIALAPLLVLSFPRIPLRGSVATWTFTAAAVFWFWHAPGAYSAALSNDAIYWLMQLSIAGTAMLLWIAVGNSSLPSAIGALLATMVAMGLLGALITFAAEPLYAPHLTKSWPWGLTAHEDQQLAGLVMWAPGGGFYLIAAILLAGRWLREQEIAEATS
jgi:putative membrane protein